MGMESIVIYLVVGLVAGRIVGMMLEGTGFGTAIDTLIGIVGAFGSGYLFSLSKITIFGFDPSIIVSAIGSLLLLYIVHKIKKAKK